MDREISALKAIIIHKEVIQLLFVPSNHSVALPIFNPGPDPELIDDNNIPKGLVCARGLSALQ